MLTWENKKSVLSQFLSDFTMGLGWHWVANFTETHYYGLSFKGVSDFASI